MQKYLEKLSMFYESLFNVVVQRRPVASSLMPCVDTGLMGGKTQFGIDWMGFILLKNREISFANLTVSVVLFSQTCVKTDLVSVNCVRNDIFHSVFLTNSSPQRDMYLFFVK